VTVPNEAAGATVAYSVEVNACRATLTGRVGTTTSGKATVVLRINPTRATRRVKVNAEVIDPVGNRSSTSRTVTLPR